jgi:hypothetical protein
MASRWISAQLKRVIGKPCSLGNWQASALTSHTT